MVQTLKFLHTILDYCGAWLMPLCLLYGIWLSFAWSHQELMALGLTSSMWMSGLAWLGLGAVCALFWPVKYREGMKGLWRENGLHIALLSLTGPWAIILGFPF